MRGLHSGREMDGLRAGAEEVRLPVAGPADRPDEALCGAGLQVEKRQGHAGGGVAQGRLQMNVRSSRKRFDERLKVVRGGATAARMAQDRLAVGGGNRPVERQDVLKDGSVHCSLIAEAKHVIDRSRKVGVEANFRRDTQVGSGVEKRVKASVGSGDASVQSSLPHGKQRGGRLAGVDEGEGKVGGLPECGGVRRGELALQRVSSSHQKQSEEGSRSRPKTLTMTFTQARKNFIYVFLIAACARRRSFVSHMCLMGEATQEEPLESVGPGQRSRESTLRLREFILVSEKAFQFHDFGLLKK